MTTKTAPDPIQTAKSLSEAGQKAFLGQIEAANQLGSKLDKLARSQFGYAVAANKDASDFMLEAAGSAFEANAKAREAALELTRNALAGFKA